MIRGIKKEDGSISVEAALIVPLLLAFLLLLTSFIKISIAEMALKESVNDTAQSVAHYSYLAMVAQGKVKQKSDGFVDSLTDKASGKLDNHEVANYILKKLGGVGKDVIPTTGDALNHFSDDVYQGIVRKKYESKVHGSDFFNPKGIVVKNSSFPTGTTGETADVRIEAENELHIVLPFFEKKIKIKKIAIERAWVGNKK